MPTQLEYLKKKRKEMSDTRMAQSDDGYYQSYNRAQKPQSQAYQDRKQLPKIRPDSSYQSYNTRPAQQTQAMDNFPSQATTARVQPPVVYNQPGMGAAVDDRDSEDRLRKLLSATGYQRGYQW